jgi:sulfur carrier protein ThiS
VAAFGPSAPREPSIERADEGETRRLPLPPLTIQLTVARGAVRSPRSVELPGGSLVRDAVRTVGFAPEGTAVLLEGRPIPLDTRLAEGMSLVVVPTYSGG